MVFNESTGRNLYKRLELKYAIAKKIAEKIEPSSCINGDRSNESHEEKNWEWFIVNELLITEIYVKNIPVRKDSKPKYLRNKTVEGVFFLIIN